MADHYLKSIIFYVIAIVLIKECSSSRVLELSDKFSEVRRDGGHWLIMFYAPWCGHCKRLDPIWAHVAQALAKTNIRVGRVDCTRFTNLARESSVTGFPTIKFIQGEKETMFLGDRTTEDIVDFALRMSSPTVQQITRPESLTNLKNMNQIFFMYVGQQEGLLWDTYFATASRLQPFAFFYSGSTEIIKNKIEIEEEPVIFVYKENMHYFYTPFYTYGEKGLLRDLHHWVNEERFETFPKVTKGNINEILRTKKYVVLVVVEENKLQQIPADMLEFRDMVESVIRKSRDKYHKVFQFGWIGNPELANSIAMTRLQLPHLLVLNSTTNHHHFPEDDPTQLTAEAIHLFLDRIASQSVPAYGGNSLAVRLYRTYFETRTFLAEMWAGNPVLTTVLFGLPLGFLSLILYSICCADILDADEDDEDEDTHEKKE